MYWTRNLVGNFSLSLFLLPCYSAGSWAEMSQKGVGWRAGRLLAKRSTLPGSERPSQRLAKHWSRAKKKDQTKALETLNQCQLFIKGSFRSGRKISKIRYNYGRKMIRPPFFIIFSGLFIQIQNCIDLDGGSFLCPNWY